MNSPNTTDSSWDDATAPFAPATAVADEMGEDPGSLLPEQTRLRGIDIPPRDTQENAQARPVLTHPMYFAPMRSPLPT